MDHNKRLKGSTELAERIAAKHGLSDSEARIIDDLANINIIILRIWKVISGGTAADAQRFVRNLYGIKESLDNLYPETDGSGDVTCLGPCILPPSMCSEAGEPCRHAPHTRVALLAMALMRYHPEFDLDVDPDEVPDTNEGMVSTEKS